MNVKNKAYIYRFGWRCLQTSRKRNIIAIIAISLMALLFTSLFTIAMSINSNFEMYTFRQIGGYNHGTFKEVTAEQIQAISQHANVDAIGKRTIIGYINDGVFSKSSAEVSYMDENCAKWSFVTPTTGTRPQRENEINMDIQALKLLGVEPELGAQITLTYLVHDQNQNFVKRTDTFTLTGWWEYDSLCPVHFINVSEDYVNKVISSYASTETPQFRTDLNVMMTSKINIQKQMEQVNLDFGYSWDRSSGDEAVRIGVNWGYTNSQLNHNIDFSIVMAILAFLALIVFTGYLIIYNIFQISVTEDIRFYGLLKTIGVTPRQLHSIIRQQALLLCVVGIPIGLLLGYAVGAVLTPGIIANTSLGTTTALISNSPVIFVASALFALITVLLSCYRPGRIAAKVSPVEAQKYLMVSKRKKKHRSTRGAKVYQMAFANLGRNQSKTILVVISLALSVVLLNILFSFTNGFHTEKYLAKESCADFIVSSSDYFQDGFSSNQFLSESQIDEIKSNVSASLSGCGYTIDGAFPISWMDEASWRQDMARYYSSDELDTVLSLQQRRGNLVATNTLIECYDESLFEKLSVTNGELSPVFQADSHQIAIGVYTDDYGHVENPEQYPSIGSELTLTYIDEDGYIDIRTGKPSTENTPEEFLEYRITKSHDIHYTVCAHVIVPTPMSHRYRTSGYHLVLPVTNLKADSQQAVIPMFYLFDTPDIVSEKAAETYLTSATSNEMSELMYESKSTLRAEFENYRHMFLLLGGVLCAIVAIVGILNFFNTITTGIVSRSKEFAMLQAVGMTHVQLKTMLIYEGLFYALSSAVSALIFSLVLNPLIGKLLEKMFWFFSPAFTILPVLISLPGFALLGWLIPSVLYRHSSKRSIVEQLRDL